MEQYLLQLVEDFRETAENVPGPDELISAAGLNLPDEFKEFADVELYLHGPLQKLSAILGIEKKELPSEEQLSDSQIIFLYDEMVRLLNTYHFTPDFPEGVSIRLKYKQLREKWESKQVLIGSGTTYLEFCHYDSETCPFPENYCKCNNFLEGDDFM